MIAQNPPQQYPLAKSGRVPRETVAHYARGPMLRRNMDKVPRETMALLAYAEAGEDFPQQIIRGVFTRDRSQGLLSQA